MLYRLSLSQELKGQNTAKLENQLVQDWDRFSLTDIHQGEDYDWMHETSGWVELQVLST